MCYAFRFNTSSQLHNTLHFWYKKHNSSKQTDGKNCLNNLFIFQKFKDKGGKKHHSKHHEKSYKGHHRKGKKGRKGHKKGSKSFNRKGHKDHVSCYFLM